MPSRPLPCLLLALPLLGVSTARAEVHAPGAILDKAALADVTARGLTNLGALAPAMIPSEVAIPAVSQGSSCNLWSWDFEVGYSFSNGTVNITNAAAAITPSAGALHVRADFDVALNDASNPFDMRADICGISVDCDGYVLPFDASIEFDLALRIVDDGAGGRMLDATVQNLVPSYSLASSNIVLEDCWIGDLETILGYVGLSIYDLVLGFAGSYITDAIEGFAGDMETMVEDAFASTTIDQSLDLGGVALDLHLYPNDIVITSAGLRIVMAGSMSTSTPSDCVADYDPGGSLMTASEPPELGNAPSGVGPFDAAILASDDIANQALYALWRGGLLCYTLDENFETFPIDTSIFGMMSIDAFDDIFPSAAPMAIVTRPRNAPTAIWSGPHTADLQVKDLGLDFIAGIDGRQARLMALSAQLDAGADITLNGGTGMLGVDLDLGSDSLTFSMAANEFAPNANDDIIGGLGGLIGSLLPTLLGSLGSIDAIQLPSFNGVGLVDLQFAPVGSAGDWLGAYATLGATPYESAGCGDEGDSGCGGGCSGLGPRPAHLALLPFVGLLLLRRRR
jgi:hypothetical protein